MHKVLKLDRTGTSLQSNYGRVLSGELSNADAIMSRMFGLFGSAGIALSMEQARIAADLYNEH